MIVVDTSALIAYLNKEKDAAAVEASLAENDASLISAGTLVELLIVSQSRGIAGAARRTIGDFGLDVVPVTEDLALLAGAAHARFGRGNHPAGLNFGDCFAYALAKARGLPLLYVGGDFALTDVRSAIA